MPTARLKRSSLQHEDKITDTSTISQRPTHACVNANAIVTGLRNQQQVTQQASLYRCNGDC